MVPRQGILWETWRCRKENLKSCSKRSQISQTGEVLLDRVACSTLVTPCSLFNLESMSPQPESGSVAKDMMGLIQPLTFAYSGIRGCELVPIAQLCLLRNASDRSPIASGRLESILNLKENYEEGGHDVCINHWQACSTRAFTKSFGGHYFSNIIAFDFHARDDMILAA
eukprot:1160656-Pelagomonas_calceolata.AAC.7